jgi:hemerythrin superfamily protein
MTRQSLRLSFAIFQGQTMATAKKISAKTVPAKKAATARKPVVRNDAISILRADHKRVSDLFAQFEVTRSDNKKQKIVAQICTELKIHSQVEEEIFYPAVKAALKDKEMVPEATVEHASVKDLIAQVEGVPAGGEMYDARVQVMGEFVKHHVKEEQNEMFAKAKATKLDMTKLGEQIRARKQELAASQKSA